MENITALLSHLHGQRNRKSFYAFISILLLGLLAYNGATIFCVHLPFPVRSFPAKVLPELVSFSMENITRETRMFSSVHSSKKRPSTAQYSVKEEGSSIRLKTPSPHVRKNQNLVVISKSNRTTMYHPKKRKKYRLAIKSLGFKDVKQFEARVTKFFKAYSCELRFFMTWIAGAESFGDRELSSVQSLYKWHPNGCLIIVSNSLDSAIGAQILRPFTEKGFKVTAISPDFNYLLKGTTAQDWYNQLKRGNVNPGEISLGQNLSNLLRMVLLYKFGGIYLDTDIIVLKSFGKLKNVIGAQNVDLATGNWSRLNNAVLIFDQGHPLLHEFIQEFALTFDGNKWGHNGPYLVSRVVSRVTGRPGYDFTVLPPWAFYPVDWSKIRSLFEGPKSLNHMKWLAAKLSQIRSKSFAVHLWNKQSKGFKVEKGSIIQQLMFSCNSSLSAVL